MKSYTYIVFTYIHRKNSYKPYTVAWTAHDVGDIDKWRIMAYCNTVITYTEFVISIANIAPLAKTAIEEIWKMFVIDNRWLPVLILESRTRMFVEKEMSTPSVLGLCIGVVKWRKARSTPLQEVIEMWFLGLFKCVVPCSRTSVHLSNRSA